MTATSKAPPVRKKFRNGWDEIDYLYQRLLYWFYERGNRSRALPLSRRLSFLLVRNDAEQASIFGQECRSLLAELDEDYPEAARHREREIELILRLWSIAKDQPELPSVGDRYGIDDLVDRFDLLAMLYHEAGELDRAIVALVRSKSLCERFKLPFAGEDLLRGYLFEKNEMILLSALPRQGGGTRLEHSHVANPKRAAAHRTRPSRPRRTGTDR
jgi:hypothetical protein